MVNKVAASFGVIMAIFIVFGLNFWFFSAFKQSRKNTSKHNHLHHLHLNDWINRKQTKANTNDVEIQVPLGPVLPRRPENAHTRSGPSRASRMSRIGRTDRVEFCDVPLDSPPFAPRVAARPGFF